MKYCNCLLIVLLIFISCSREENDLLKDYSGKYQGFTLLTVTPGPNPQTNYDMVIDISKGSNNQEIKILFGNWLTMANLSGSKFIIQETNFTGITTTGSGEFIDNNKVKIIYTQNIANSTIANYTGTLTKF